MVKVGVDAGTKSYGVFVLEERKLYEFESSEVRENPESFVEFLKELNPEVGAGLSGYGLPIKNFKELTDKDIFLMTLKKEGSYIGMSSVIRRIRDEELNFFTIPGVIHLNTVPAYRKVNRIDMGTSDKVCSAALALAEFGEGDFILAEIGYGFNAFLALKNGKIVDGIGGSSGFPSHLSVSAIDAELACLMRVTKDVVFSGGLKSFFEDRGEEFSFEAFAEWILKGIYAMKAVVDENFVVLSGRFAKEVKKFIAERFDVKILKGFESGKQAAEGAAIIADGLSGGEYKEIVERLELRRASGCIFDYVTSDLKKFFFEKLEC